MTVLTNALRELAGLFIDDGALALVIIAVVVLTGVVATLLLGLRSDSRDEQAKDRPATERVDEEYVEVLSGWRYKEKRDLTRGEFFLALSDRDRADANGKAISAIGRTFRRIQRPQKK